MGLLQKLTGMAAVDAAANPQPVIFTTKTYLKIKIVSLAAEARLIRHEEARWISKEGRRDHPIRMGLMDHRKKDVRMEARCALLAYGLLRGRAYKSIEAKCFTEPNWNRVSDLVEKYGPYRYRQTGERERAWADVKAWRQAG